MENHKKKSMSSTEETSRKESKRLRTSCYLFVEKVYQLCTNEEYSEAIGFGGTSLEIRNPIKLAPILLQFFKHSNVSSFIRQLNNYGFKSVPCATMADGVVRYMHPNFVQNKPELLVKIGRKGGCKLMVVPSSSQNEEGSDVVDRKRLRETESELDLLREKCDELELENKRLRLAYGAFVANSSTNSNSVPEFAYASSASSSPRSSYHESSSSSVSDWETNSNSEEEDLLLDIIDPLLDKFVPSLPAIIPSFTSQTYTCASEASMKQSEIGNFHCGTSADLMFTDIFTNHGDDFLLDCFLLDGFL